MMAPPNTFAPAAVSPSSKLVRMGDMRKEDIRLRATRCGACLRIVPASRGGQGFSVSSMIFLLRSLLYYLCEYLCHYDLPVCSLLTFDFDEANFEVATYGHLFPRCTNRGCGVRERWRSADLSRSGLRVASS